MVISEKYRQWFLIGIVNYSTHHPPSFSRPWRLSKGLSLGLPWAQNAQILVTIFLIQSKRAGEELQSRNIKRFCDIVDKTIGAIAGWVHESNFFQTDSNDVMVGGGQMAN